MINENKISAMKYRDEIQDIAGKIYRHLFDTQNNENYSKDFTMKSNPNVYITLCGQKTYKYNMGIVILYSLHTELVDFIILKVTAYILMQMHLEMLENYSEH